MRRSQMSAAERAKRSRLTQLVSQRELLRGTLTIRERKCGKAGCRCIRGNKHVSLYLTYSQDGSQEQVYVPRQWEEKVREWVKNYQDLQSVLEQISKVYLEKLRRKEG